METEPLFQSEPVPGVRRHLVTILAGACLKDAVAAIAERDDDPYVRATAYQHAMGIAEPQDLEAIGHWILDAAVSDSHPVVREQCLRLLAGRWPRHRYEDVLGLLDDRNGDVRKAAADLVFERPFEQRVAERLVEHARQELDPDLRSGLWERLIESGWIALVVQTLAEISKPSVAEALHSLVVRKRRFLWPQIGFAATLGDPLVDSALLDLLPTPEAADVLFLADRALRMLSTQVPPNELEESPLQWVGVQALDALVDAAQKPDRPSITSPERNVLVQIVEGLTRVEGELFDERRWDRWEHLGWPDEVSRRKAALMDWLARGT